MGLEESSRRESPRVWRGLLRDLRPPPCLRPLVTWAPRPAGGAGSAGGGEKARLMPASRRGRRGGGAAGQRQRRRLRAGDGEGGAAVSLARLGLPRSHPAARLTLAAPLRPAPSPLAARPAVFLRAEDTKFCPGFPALPASSHLHPRRHFPACLRRPIRWPSSSPGSASPSPSWAPSCSLHIASQPRNLNSHHQVPVPRFTLSISMGIIHTFLAPYP